MKKLFASVLVMLTLCTISDAAPGKTVGQYISIFGDEADWNYLMDTVPFNKIDMLYIAFFQADLDQKGLPKPDFLSKDELGPKGFKLEPSQEQRVKDVVSHAREKNKNIIILASLSYRSEYYTNILKNPRHFASETIRFLKKYNLDGFDIDYENSAVIPVKDFDRISNALRTEFAKASKAEHKKYYLTLTPDVSPTEKDHKGITSKTLNHCFDYINVQSYSAWGNWPGLLETYIGKLPDGGYVKKSKITAGLMSEKKDAQTPPDDADARIDRMNSDKLAGIFAWRIDTDSPDSQRKPTYLVADKMWNGVHKK